VEHFTWFSAIPGLNRIPDHVVTSLFVCALLILCAIISKRQTAAAADATIPDDGITPRNLLEIYVEGFRSLVEGVLGPQGRPYVALYGTFFLFILVSNLLGLIPGFSPPTSNINVPAALGVTSFVLFNYFGFKAHGGGYLKHFLGPVWWLIPLMLPLELIDVCLRPITLTLRLTINMVADHLVLGVFTDLTKLVIPVVFLLLGTLVSVIQAFVFTLLSLVYVALAVGGHEEEHEHAHAH
jgi:F-type H+-transporting ATPase subunit a